LGLDVQARILDPQEEVVPASDVRNVVLERGPLALQVEAGLPSHALDVHRKRVFQKPGLESRLAP
jgi:hypothetical protein